MDSIKNRKTRNRASLFLIFGGAIFLWGLGWFLITNYIDKEDRGIFGDMFGSVNALFSALALGGIIYSIILQRNELALQRKELKETKEEFKNQNFQTTFFNLLRTQQQIVNEIKASIGKLRSWDREEFRVYEGRQFISQCRRELNRINKAIQYGKHPVYIKYMEEDQREYIPRDEFEEESLYKSQSIAFVLSLYKIDKELQENSKNLNGLDYAERLYSIFFNKYHFVIGHYFRHIYHILLFLEQSELERLQVVETHKEKLEIRKEFQQFAEFVQAQMSTPELFLLFYNCLSFPNIKRLLIKYNTLENMTVEDLLDPEHNCVKGIKLKSRKELLKAND